MLAARCDVPLVVAVGGALGSLARWALEQAVPTPSDGFPWATLLANVSGAFAIGVLMVLAVDGWPPSRLVRPFLGVGVLGGYTTVSTAMLDTRALLATDQAALGAAYLLATSAAGLAAVWAGALLARRATRRSAS